MKGHANTTLGKKLAAKYHRATCSVYRKTQAGWTLIAASVKITILDSSDRPMRPDPYDAGTDNTRTWNISFPLNQDVQMKDQLRNVVDINGETLPILTVATNFQTDITSSKWVVAQAEDSAVMWEWITFWRWNQTNEDYTETTGPYQCTIDWEDLAGYDPDSYEARAHWGFAVLTGPEDMDVHHSDVVESVDGRKGFKVIEVRKAIAGRKEVRVRGDIGFRE